MTKVGGRLRPEDEAKLQQCMVINPTFCTVWNGLSQCVGMLHNYIANL